MSDEPKDFEWIPARICVIAHAYPDQHQALMVSRLQLAKMKIFVRPFPDVAVNPAMRQQYNSLGCATETWWKRGPKTPRRSSRTAIHGFYASTKF